MTLSADLDRYTDGAAMRTLLQARLPGFAEGRLRIDALTVSHARRNTSRDRNPCPLALCYALQVSDTAQRRSGTQLLYARVYRANQAASVYAQQDQRLLAAPAFGQALTHLADLDMVLWALPNDPELPQLARLLDPIRAAHLVPGAAGAGVDVELLRYTPQRRATLRYTLGGAAPATARSGPTQLYAKTFCDGSAELLHQRFCHFWQRAQADAQAPLVAQPLGCDAATRTLWQAPAPGLPLRGMLGASDAAALMGGVARALALLHESGLAPAASATPRSVEHGVAEARRRERKIARADAALAPLAASVADALDHHAAHLATRPLSLIHGDFHPDQIWVHQGRVVLFDFDEFTLGDPMEDLAAFAIKLEALGAAPVLVAAFVDQYAAAAPRRFDRRALAWHLTLQSLLQASRAFIYQQPGWAQTLASRLAASAERAAALSEPETT